MTALFIDRYWFCRCWQIIKSFLNSYKRISKKNSGNSGFCGEICLIELFNKKYQKSSLKS